MVDASSAHVTKGESTLFGCGLLGEADNLRTGNDETAKVVGVDVRPSESAVHPGKGGEIAGRWCVTASIPHANLDTTWEVLGLADLVKGNELIAN